jgi:hypothetical protein
MRGGRRKETDIAIGDAKQWFHVKLESLEQRIVSHTDQRISQQIDQSAERIHVLNDVIATTERWDRQKRPRPPSRKPSARLRRSSKV